MLASRMRMVPAAFAAMPTSTSITLARSLAFAAIDLICALVALGGMSPDDAMALTASAPAWKSVTMASLNSWPATCPYCLATAGVAPSWAPSRAVI